jgi:DNA-binding MarR family transcriptional regulator
MSPLHLLHDSGLVRAPQIIMLRLLTSDLSGASPTAIALSTGLSKTAVSMALSALVVAALVERRYMSRDQRSVMMYLTDEGRGKAAAMQEAVEGFAEDVKKREGRVHP